MVFAPGKSGNPSGRPKEHSEIKRLALEASPQAFSVIVSLLHDQDKKVAMSAAKEILDRAFGKPGQSVELSGNKERPLQALLEIVKNETKSA